jgi:hypothetical protein
MAVEEKCIKQNVGGEKHYLLYEHEGDVTAIGPFIYLDNAKIWRAGFEWDRDDDIKIIGIVSNLIQSEQITVRAPLGVS